MPWRVIVPIKPLDGAKSRLGVPGPIRPALAFAFALDAIDAMRQSPEVATVVVTTNAGDLTDELVRRGIEVVSDPGQGLNAAITGASSTNDDTAALVGDLPSVRSDEITQALRRARSFDRAFVCDAMGVGTTLLTARAGVPLDPHFGEHSRAAHRASGAVEIEGALPGLRRDVDTTVDLWDAQRLGVGARTQMILSSAHE